MLRLTSDQVSTHEIDQILPADLDQAEPLASWLRVCD